MVQKISKKVRKLMSQEIPKIIHYCWFGHGPLPESTMQYMKTWKNFLPGYQIVEWNEDNFEINTAPAYVQEAYQAKKYAFVSDYVRMVALYKYGGIYFDTDLEIIKDFQGYLTGKSLVLCFESEKMLMTAMIACTKEHPFIKQFLQKYETRHFIKDDGSYDDTPNTDFWSVQAEQWGINLSSNKEQTIQETITVYPEDIFSAYDLYNCHEKITKRTCTVHHMEFSWASKHHKRRYAIIHFLQKVFGIDRYDHIRKRLKELKKS